MLLAYLPEFSTLALIHLLAVIAPGPDFALCLRQSLHYGQKIGIITALGIGCGLSLHIAYSLIGVSALIHSHPAILLVGQCIGAAYLLYLGQLFLRSQPRSEHAQNADLPTTPSLTRAFIMGFLTNATNPKATLFFLAIFTTVVSEQTPLVIQLGYGLWMCVITAVWFILVSLLFTQSKVQQWFWRKGFWLERVIGGLLIIVAVRLLYETAALFG